MTALRVGRVTAALVFLFVGFVILANIATIWHGALFIAGMPPLVWAFLSALDWAMDTGENK